MVRDGACRIIIGNVPEYVDEELLKPLFSEAGAIVSLELVKRADDGRGGKPRHKGYGFCEYEDKVSRDAAVRNLNGRAVGGISLRVKPADGAKEQHMRQHETEMREVPRLELEATTPIASALKKLTLAEACEMMQQMKQMCADDEEKAKRVLGGNPRLCMAFLHIFYYFGIIGQDPEEKQKLSMKHKAKRKEREREERDAKRRKRMGIDTPPPEPSPPPPPAAPTLPPSQFAPPAGTASPQPRAASTPSPTPPPAQAPDPLETELAQLPKEARQQVNSLPAAVLAGWPEEDRKKIEGFQAIMAKNPTKWL